MSEEGGDRDEGNRNGDRNEESAHSGEPELLDRVLKALTERRRRYALYYLREQEVCDVDDLADHVAEIEADRSAVDEDDRRETKTRLVHTDLPALVDAGFIEYNGRSETVRYSDPPPVLEKLLDVAVDIDRPDGSG